MKSKFISSNQNPLIKNISLLQKKKTERKKQGVFIVEGIKVINDIPENYNVKYYITSENFNQQQLTKLEEEKWITVTEDIYKSISDTDSPQGAMAVVEQKHQLLETIEVKDKTFCLVLENMQDPGNLGTVIRTAYGFGVDYIIVSKGSVDVYSPKTIRSTMGALFHVPIILDVEMEETLKVLKEKGMLLYTTALEESKPLFEADLSAQVALIIGNEANGASELAKEMADYKVHIPMPGGLESLNASIAASICMYEVMRQRIV